ncbi:MAG: D-2-hydroxyacid dehydrogenase [Eubacteriales bacterium]|nr:D-2-hydroxyacid dehydrogenase [Eubacteriales bacterium]
MKIVVLDGYVLNPGDLSWSPLEALGEVTVYDRTSFDAEDPLIVERIGDAEIVVINKTPISKTTIDACPNLRAIAVVATGFNVVDYEYARQKQIPVFNVPGYGTQIVAQYSVGLLMEICSHFQHHSDGVYAGKWNNCPDFCYWDYPMIELCGKTAGIIGLGRIGRATAKILNALEMKVLAYGSRECEEGRKVAEYTDLDTLLEKSDVIFLHCPLFPETQGIINQENIAKMKDGVILINSGRGQLIVEEDLADALNSGKVYAAGLDVVSTEPIREDNPLLKAKNCLITPHIAWAAQAARQRILDTTVKNIENYLHGEMTNVVNPW